MKEENFQQSSAKKSILDPIVSPYELNKVELDHVKNENNEGLEQSSQKFETSLDNELKEFVKQRYQKRYRSKFRKSGTGSNLIDETIIEETDQDLIEAESDLNNDSDMFKKHLKSKPKKEVTFAAIEAKPLVVKNQESEAAVSSEDEFNGYDKVVVSQNLAEEILDEIYGKIDTLQNGGPKYENSSVSENGAIEAPLESPNKSLADEILDELYGHNKKCEPEFSEDENSYEEISKPDLEQPVIQGKNCFFLIL